MDTKTIPLTVPPSEAGLPEVPFGKNTNGRIKKPINAFLVWARIHRSIIKKANPKASFKELSEQMGILWSNLSKEEKQPYYEEAFKIKQRHDNEFPDWEYRPNIGKKRNNTTDPDCIPSTSANILQTFPATDSGTSQSAKLPPLKYAWAQRLTSVASSSEHFLGFPPGTHYIVGFYNHSAGTLNNSTYMPDINQQ